MAAGGDTGPDGCGVAVVRGHRVVKRCPDRSGRAWGPRPHGPSQLVAREQVLGDVTAGDPVDRPRPRMPSWDGLEDGGPAAVERSCCRLRLNGAAGTGPRARSRGCEAAAGKSPIAPPAPVRYGSHNALYESRAGGIPIDRTYGRHPPSRRASPTGTPHSYRDPLDDVAGDLLLGAVVEVGRPGVGVPQQVLHLLPRAPSASAGSSPSSPGTSGSRTPPAAGPRPASRRLTIRSRSLPVQAPVGQLPLPPPGGAEQGRLVGPALQAGGPEVALHLELEVVPRRDLVELAALLAEVEVTRTGRR